MLRTLIVIAWIFIGELLYARQPYLFTNQAKLATTRKAIAIQESHYFEAFQLLKKRVDQQDLAVYGEDINRYNRAYYAQEAAFVSLILSNEIERKKYANLAFLGIKDIYEASEQERFPHLGYGLSRAMMQLGLALPYAWCKSYWTKEQASYVEGKIEEALIAWQSYTHANFGNTRGSNWVAVCRGGELVLLLALQNGNIKDERYQFLVGELLKHMQNGYGDLGVSQEGIGYTEYGGSFLLKAVQAAVSAGDSTLYYQAQNHAWWKQAMYVASFQGFERKSLMTGVSGSGNYNEGWASLLFPLVPTNMQAYYQWWYDRHMGLLSKLNDGEKYDGQRAGTIWAILNYPQETTAKNPTGIFPSAVKDNHGYFFFRNRWKDENDILFSIMADEKHHGNAWDQPEVFALNLMAYNTRFVGGPSKERENDLYSSLLVDGNYNFKGAVNYVGKTVDYVVDKQKASLSIDGGTLYKKLGLTSAIRNCAVKYLPDNAAIICIKDHLVSDEIKKFTWQLNLGDQKSNDSIVVEQSNNHFQLKGRNGYIDGWVMQPDNFEIEQDNDPFQIHFSGKNTHAFVILYLHQKEMDSLKIDKIRENSQYQLLNHTITVSPTTTQLIEIK